MPNDIDPLQPQPKSPADLTWLSNAAGVPQMVQALGGSLANLWQLPKQAFQASENLRTTGDYDPAPVTQIASMLVGGGLPAAEEGAAGVFGGRLAQTANLPQLYKAKMSESMGANPTDIYHDTGWYRGLDKQWRFEIPDVGANLSASHINSNNLGGVLDHPDLYKAYPDLEKIPFTWDAPPGSASHSPFQGKEKISASPFKPLYQDTSNLMEQLLHEAQHAVQWREGFTNGTNPRAMVPHARQALEQVGGFDPSAPESAADNLTSRVAFEAYRRHAGEVEARNVADRYKYSKIAPPWETQDVPSSKQIVLYPFSNSPYQDIIKALNK